MSEAASVPPLLNRFMKSVLRSPAHRLVSKNVLLITFTGRKSGRRYTTPVSYSQSGDEVTVFTHANWWKNLQGGAPVTLRIRGHECPGRAETIAEDKQAVAAGLTTHLKNVRTDARYYGVTFDEAGNPKASEIQEAVASVVMIRIHL